MAELKSSAPINIENLPRERATDFKSIYCNNASFGFSQFDATITLSEIVANPGANPTVLDHIAVTMSWEHFVTLHEAMGKLITRFESAQKVKIPRVGDFSPAGI